MAVSLLFVLLALVLATIAAIAFRLDRQLVEMRNTNLRLSEEYYVTLKALHEQLAKNNTGQKEYCKLVKEYRQLQKLHDKTIKDLKSFTIYLN